MPLDMEVGLSPGNIVLDTDPAKLPPQKGAQTPSVGGSWVHVGPCLLWPNGRLSQQLLSSCYLKTVHTDHQITNKIQERVPDRRTGS